jgi:DNA-binding response OmpR family regulator
MSIDKCFKIAGKPCTFRPRVLILDDEPLTLDLQKLMYERLGLEVDTIDDPSKIDHRVREYDAFISDTFGPRWYGPKDAVQALKDHGFKGVVLGNSNSGRSDVPRDWQAAGYQFMRKPMAFREYQAPVQFIKEQVGCRCSR